MDIIQYLRITGMVKQTKGCLRMGKNSIEVVNGVIDVKQVPNYVWKDLAKSLIPTSIEYYKDPENQRKYEEWHFKKYGCYPEKTSYNKARNDNNDTANNRNN
jgi:hypothetical protein